MKRTSNATSAAQQRRLDLVTDGVMDVTAAARFLGVCRVTLYTLINSGELATVKVRRRRMIPVAAARQYLADRLVEGR